MNLSFACSLRIREVPGLTWDNVHITDDDIASDDARIDIDKKLERVSMRTLKVLDKKALSEYLCRLCQTQVLVLC